MNKIFSKIGEKEVTTAIVESFMKQLLECITNDVIIVGGGPAGLTAAKELASKKLKVLIIERNNYLGGGFWSGGYLMNKTTVRSPGEKVLAEIGVPLEKFSDGLYVTDATFACAKLISETLASGAKVLNMTYLEDVVIKHNRVTGVVVNWTPIMHLPKEISALDPIGLESKYVIDATGHDAQVVKKLEQRGLVKTQGGGAMWIEESEDLIVEHTSEIFPGLIVAGMAVSTVYGLPRMGPTFGGMFISGKKAAEIILKSI